jgi:phosphoglycolate phosphatase
MDTSLHNQFDSIIFDLDGTLWDSTANVALAWQAALSKVDYIDELMTVERVKSITGMTYDAIFDKLFPNLTDTEQRKEVQALCGISELKFCIPKAVSYIRNWKKL